MVLRRKIEHWTIFFLCELRNRDTDPHSSLLLATVRKLKSKVEHEHRSTADPLNEDSNVINMQTIEIEGWNDLGNFILEDVPTRAIFQ